VIRHPEFDAGESDRLEKRHTYATEWAFLARGFGVLGMTAIGILILYTPIAYSSMPVVAVLALAAGSFFTYFWFSPRLARTLWILAPPSAHLFLIVIVFVWASIRFGTTPPDLIVYSVVSYGLILLADNWMLRLWPHVAKSLGWRASAPFRD